MDIHNYRRRLEREIVLLSKAEHVRKQDRKKILGFKDYLLSEGIGAPKIARYMQDCRKLCKLLEKPLERATEGDLRRVIAHMEQGPLAAETKVIFKVLVRKLYRYLRGCRKKGEYPSEVEWITINLPRSKRKLPEELLTDKEIKALVRAAEGKRDKALIAVLAESGARVSEIGTMRVKHVSFEKHGARLSIHGKTGTRKILTVWCTPYLLEWLNSHPHNDQPERPLWHNFKSDSFLCYTRIAAIVRKAARRAGIKKRVYPHLLRHSRATQMASVMSEAAMKQYFGWTQSSKMAGIYVHMSGRDTDDAVLRANGITVEKKAKARRLESPECIRCRTVNEATNRFCKICGMPLRADEANEAVQLHTADKEIGSVMGKLLQDPEVLELLKKKLQSNP